MAQWVEEPASKSYDLSLVPLGLTWWKGRTSSYKLSFDQLMCTMTCAILVHTANKSNKQAKVSIKTQTSKSSDFYNSVFVVWCFGAGVSLRNPGWPQAWSRPAWVSLPLECWDWGCVSPHSIFRFCIKLYHVSVPLEWWAKWVFCFFLLMLNMGETSKIFQ